MSKKKKDITILMDKKEEKTLIDKSKLIKVYYSAEMKTLTFVDMTGHYQRYLIDSGYMSISKVASPSNLRPGFSPLDPSVPLYYISHILDIQGKHKISMQPPEIKKLMSNPVSLLYFDRSHPVVIQRIKEEIVCDSIRNEIISKNYDRAIEIIKSMQDECKEDSTLPIYPSDMPYVVPKYRYPYPDIIAMNFIKGPKISGRYGNKDLPKKVSLHKTKNKNK
jgi:hypothetical protein